MMEDPDIRVRSRAATEWLAWEDAVISQESSGSPGAYGNRPDDAKLAFVRICSCRVPATVTALRGRSPTMPMTSRTLRSRARRVFARACAPGSAGTVGPASDDHQRFRHRLAQRAGITIVARPASRSFRPPTVNKSPDSANCSLKTQIPPQSSGGASLRPPAQRG